MSNPAGELPECLTHCDNCGQPFDEPVLDWDDYFTEIEDVSFYCAMCFAAEGEWECG